MVAAATKLTATSGVGQFGKNGCTTYLATVNPIMAFVVGLKEE